MARIFIIKLGALGDVVMATSLIRQIQHYHQNDEVWLLTAPEFTGIFNNHENLNVVSFGRKGFIENIKTLSWIREKKFSRVYDLQSNDRSSLLCAFSGITERVGNHPRFPYNIHPAEKYTGQCHIYDRMLQVLAAAGIKPVHEPPVLPATEQEMAQVHIWLQQNDLKDREFVILHAGASSKHPEKCWPHFLELAKIIAKTGHKIIWIGSDADAAINKKLGNEIGFDVSGIFSISELAELGKHARFAVTNDSGPMHILSASCIPVFAFFGPTNWSRNHAIGQAENVICAESVTADGFKPTSLDKLTIDQAIAHIRGKGLI